MASERNLFSIYGTHPVLYYLFFFFVDGHYLVAVSSGSVALPVRCYRVSVRKTDDKCHITSQALPSFFLHDGVVKDNICRFY